MSNRDSVFIRNLREHIELMQNIGGLSDVVEEASKRMANIIQAGGRIFFCGNGGSAADAQHLAAELSGRYLKNRRPLDGTALHCNTSAMTAIANDYSYDDVFSRQLAAHGRTGDALVAISTSGNSINVLKAAETAKVIGMTVIGMTGACGGQLKDLSDVIIAVPSNCTPRVQEAHIFIGHVMCEMIEMACCR